MPLSTLTITNFLLASGAPVADGTVTIRLNKDAQSSAGQVSTKVDTIELDANGAPIGPPVFWPNNALLPNNTVYNIKVFNATGEIILGPLAILVGPNTSMTGFGASFGGSFGS